MEQGKNRMDGLLWSKVINLNIITLRSLLDRVVLVKAKHSRTIRKCVVMIWQNAWHPQTSMS